MLSRPTVEQIEDVERKLREARSKLARRPTRAQFLKAKKEAEESKDAIRLKDEMMRHLEERIQKSDHDGEIMVNYRYNLEVQKEELRKHGAKTRTRLRNALKELDEAAGLAEEFQQTRLEFYHETNRLRIKMWELESTDPIIYLQQREQEIENKWTTRVGALETENGAMKYEK